MSFSQGSVILQQKRSSGPVTNGARNGTQISGGYVQLGGSTAVPFLADTYVDTAGYIFKIGDLDAVAHGSYLLLQDAQDLLECKLNSAAALMQLYGKTANKSLIFSFSAQTVLSLDKTNSYYSIGPPGYAFNSDAGNQTVSIDSGRRVLSATGYNNIIQIGDVGSVGGNTIVHVDDNNATITIKATTITFNTSGTALKYTNALTNGAAAAAGTLLNAPAAGNPTKWIPINDAGTTRYIPCW